jgi:hypothetical protein
MLSWVGVAVTVLASPAGMGGTQAMSEAVLSPSLVRHVPERSAAAHLEDWLGNLALVRPEQVGGVSGLRIFVAVAPVSRHSVGLQALGSF